MENENKKTRSHSQSLHLHGEIIEEEILSRLPVKSLLRLRCVSKPWLSLIASKRFIKTHLKNYTKKQLADNRWRVILFCETHGLNQHGPKRSSLRSSDDDPDLELCPIDDPKNNHLIKGTTIVNYCNGLLCIYKKPGCFFFWNPATRVSVELPKLDLQNLEIEKWGFGWDEQIGEYKVFVGLSDQDHKIGQLYSWKTNSWKTIEHGSLSPFLNGIYACGKIHWMIMTSGRCIHIESFDLESEVFGLIELPYKPEVGVRVGLFWEMEGCLSVVYVDYEKARRSFWIMKQYGVKESWMKVSSWPCEERVQRCCKTSLYIESLVSPIAE